MNRTNIYFIIGFIPVINIIYRLATCIPCDGNFFGYTVSGTTDLIINAVLAFWIFNGVYKERKKDLTGS